MRKAGANPLHYAAPERSRGKLFLVLLFGACVAFGVYAALFWWLHIGLDRGP